MSPGEKLPRNLLFDPGAPGEGQAPAAQRISHLQGWEILSTGEKKLGLLCSSAFFILNLNVSKMMYLKAQIKRHKQASLSNYLEIILLLIEEKETPHVSFFIDKCIFIYTPNCEAHFTLGSGWFLLLTQAPETP